MIDNMAFHTQAWLSFFAELGINMTADEVHHQNYGTIEEVIHRIVGNHLSDVEVRELAERKEALYRDLYRPHLKLINGLQDFLDEAKQLGVIMAIATSAGQGNIEFVLEGLHLHPYFDVIVGGDQVRHGKPHPETFLRAAEKLAVAPEQCLVFEDSPPGVEAAHRAGMRAIVITTTFEAQGFQGLPAVDRIINDFTSLSALRFGC